MRALANSSDTPWQFMEAVFALEGLTVSKAAEKMGISKAGYYVAKNADIISLEKGLTFSEAFGINPTIVNHLIADYKLQKIQESRKQNQT